MLSPTQLTTVFALLVLAASQQPTANAGFSRLVDLFEQKMETLTDIANATAHHLLEAKINRTERRQDMLNDLLKIVFQYSLDKQPNATLYSAYGKKKHPAGNDQDYDLVVSKTYPSATYVVRSGSSKVRRSKYNDHTVGVADVTEGKHNAHYDNGVTFANHHIHHKPDVMMSKTAFSETDDDGSSAPVENQTEIESATTANTDQNQTETEFTTMTNPDENQTETQYTNIDAIKMSNEGKTTTSISTTKSTTPEILKTQSTDPPYYPHEDYNDYGNGGSSSLATNIHEPIVIIATMVCAMLGMIVL